VLFFAVSVVVGCDDFSGAGKHCVRIGFNIVVF
jgi:hypothetical protein